MNADDEQLSELMIGYWTRFARTGNPNGDGAPPWPAYSAKIPQVQPLEGSAPGNTIH